METFGRALSVISACIDLAHQIDSLIQKNVQSQQLHEGVATTSELLTQFHRMPETSCLPQEILDNYLKDILPLQAELENIRGSLDSYLPLCSRKGFAGLAWKYRWGKEIDRYQRNLGKLNGRLRSALATLNLKVELLTLENRVRSPSENSDLQLAAGISRRYLEAAQALRSRESPSEPPITQIQRTYSIAAKALQGEEWNPLCSSRLHLLRL